MEIYLPIADLPVNIFLVFAMGLAVGFISGMFGIGGGFLMTPLLIFIGVSPAVAVATVSSHIAASSFSGALLYWRRRALDLALALMLLVGGLIGTGAGVWLFTQLRAIGQLDLVDRLSYVILLGSVGGPDDTGKRARHHPSAERRAGRRAPRRAATPGCTGCPIKVRFKQSRLYVSAIPVWVIGVLMGFLGAIMGIGGGFLLVPMLIYLLRVPTNVVIGTSMVLTLVTMATATVLHAATNHLVDAVLALDPDGRRGDRRSVRRAQPGQKMRSERLRLLLGLLVFAVGLRFAIDLFLPPGEVYSFRLLAGER